jgi:hypothetical protein
VLIGPKMAHDLSDRIEMQTGAPDVFGPFGLDIGTEAS